MRRKAGPDVPTIAVPCPTCGSTTDETRDQAIEFCARFVEMNVHLNVRAAHRIADGLRAFKGQKWPPSI